MKKSDNAAWRLHEILSKLRANAGGISVQAVFAKVFQIDENDLPAMYRTLLTLQASVDETEVRIKRTQDINHALYLRSMPTIRKALAISSWGNAWAPCLQHLTETSVADIAFCADLLSKTYHEIPIKEEELKAIKEELNNLFERVSRSSINKILKQVILDLLEQIRRSVADYQIRGASVLHDSIALSLGELLLNYQDVQNEKENEDLKAVWAFLVRLEFIVSKAMEYKPLLENYLPILLPAIAGQLPQ